MSAMISILASTAIELDTNTLFDQVNLWLTNMMPAFAVFGGINIAIVILKFVIGSIYRAFNRFEYRRLDRKYPNARFDFD
jgi:hypothetical protein